jgi:hypothetical protein
VLVKWAELKDGVCVTFSLSKGSSGLVWHLESLVNTWQIHFVKSLVLISSLRESIQEGKRSILDANSIVLVEETLIRRRLGSITNLVLIKLVAVISLLDSMLNSKLVVHVVESLHQVSLAASFLLISLNHNFLTDRHFTEDLL